jgi:hypothetical protein
MGVISFSVIVSALRGGFLLLCKDTQKNRNRVGGSRFFLALGNHTMGICDFTDTLPDHAITRKNDHNAIHNGHHLHKARWRRHFRNMLQSLRSARFVRQKRSQRL